MKRNLLHALIFLTVFAGTFWLLKDDVGKKTKGMRNPPREVRAWAPGDSALVDSLVVRGADRAFTCALFSDLRFGIDDDIAARFTIKDSARTKKRLKPYWWLFTKASIMRGREFIAVHRKFLDSVGHPYGVPPHILAAVLRAESNFGFDSGKDTVVKVLYTRVRYVAEKQQSEELDQFACVIRMVTEREFDCFALVGSWGSAFGYPQFRPCSYLAYAVDGNGDGTADLFVLDDAIPSIANYLYAHGWSERELHQLKALRAYNRGSYAGAVMAYASRISSE